MKTKILVQSALLITIASILSMIKVFQMPLGGSITLFSMLFITIIGYLFGPKTGIISGLVYGLLQFILSPWFINPIQIFLDYFLGFSSLCFGSIFFVNKTKYALEKQYITGIFFRLIFTTLSGVFFYSSTAPENFQHGFALWLFSLSYNSFYILPEGVITLFLIRLSSLRQVIESKKIDR